MLPPLEAWPDYPLLLRLSPDVYAADPTATLHDGATGEALDPRAALAINNADSPIAFETELFNGEAVLRIADLPPNDSFPGGRGGSALAGEYFAGKRRKMQVVVQGRFKTSGLRFDQVCF
jgi:hypothetical protein